MFLLMAANTSYLPAIFQIALTVARNIHESCELINDRKSGLGVKYCRILFGSADQVVCHEQNHITNQNSAVQSVLCFCTDIYEEK